MGICLTQQLKLNGIIDNESSYQIIYHVSGSRQQIYDYEEQLNLGPKIGLGLQKIQAQGINYNTKKRTKHEKYYSQARLPKHSYCSVGLNNIEVGCFLSIYATKINQSTNQQVYKKLIMKDICIRTNQDICIRINKDLTIKQLTDKQIEQMKRNFQQTGLTTFSTIKVENNRQQQQVKSIKTLQKQQKPQQQTHTTRLLANTIYLKQVFGQSNYKNFYILNETTGMYDLNHMDVKINMKKFVQYDWVYLEIIQLDGCGIDDKGWCWFFQDAAFCFPNLKQIYLGIGVLYLVIYRKADNLISTIQYQDLEQFPSLKLLALDYGPQNGNNPLSEDSKKNLLKYALQHPQTKIYCASIDQNQYLYEIVPQMVPQMPPQNITWQNLNSYNPQNNNNIHLEQNLAKNKNVKQNNSKNSGWFLFLPPEPNNKISNTLSIRSSNKNIATIKTKK